MVGGGGDGMLLGGRTPLVREYSPDILYAIPRKAARINLGLSETLPFFGVDQWHAYEMSWLDASAKPSVCVGRFSVPATSPNIVESKSFKLYLNSLNNTRFESADEVRKTIIADISGVVGEGIELELLAVDDSSLVGLPLQGESLDLLPTGDWSGEPKAEQLRLRADHGVVNEMVYSHLLRSLCPVTGQPDWATVWIHYCGAALDHSSLLQYIIAYREHQEFHEQCVERMFCDISSRCEPQFLHIQAFYTRRGGLDINPFRTTDPDARPLGRLNRQ